MEIGSLGIESGGGLERTWRVVAPPKLRQKKVNVNRVWEGRQYASSRMKRGCKTGIEDSPVATQGDLLDIDLAEPLLAQTFGRGGGRGFRLLDDESVDLLASDERGEGLEGLVDFVMADLELRLTEGDLVVGELGFG